MIMTNTEMVGSMLMVQVTEMKSSQIGFNVNPQLRFVELGLVEIKFLPHMQDGPLVKYIGLPHS